MGLSSALCGCAGGADIGAVNEPRLDGADRLERRPSGVAVDLSAEPTRVDDRASADDGTVSLRAPLSKRVAYATVQAYFDAIVREDLPGLLVLVREGAQVEDTGASGTRTVHPIATMWRERFNKRDHHELAQALVYREADIVTFRSEEIDGLPVAVRFALPFSDMEPGDLVLQVPIVTPMVRSERYLGSEMYFWLRREEGRYLIVRIAEDLPL
jgi:hypothetical protein